jgi:membrane protease YdiL (CAAX protease family)
MADAPPRLTGIFRGTQLHATVILLLAGVLPLAWRFFGTEEFYNAHLTAWRLVGSDPSVNAATFRFANAVLAFGIVPALVVVVGFRHSLADYGVTAGHWRRVLIWIVLTVPMFVISSYVAAGMPEFQSQYPVNRSAGASASMFAFHALSYLAFYIGWEFFFRGFLLFGLEKPLGPVNAILIQAIVSSLLHIGDPASEAFGGFFIGLLWGFMAFRTRSLLPSLAGHAALGLALDWFLCFGGR